MKNIAIRAAFIAALALALGGCFGGNQRALVEDNTASMPFFGRNVRTRSTNVAGLYASTDVSAPDGQQAINGCTETVARWIERPAVQALLRVLVGNNNWFQQMNAQGIIGTARDCINLVLHGVPMPGSNGYTVGMGGGRFNGRTFKE